MSPRRLVTRPLICDDGEVDLDGTVFFIHYDEVRATTARKAMVDSKTVYHTRQAAWAIIIAKQRTAIQREQAKLVQLEAAAAGDDVDEVMDAIAPGPGG